MNQSTFTNKIYCGTPDAILWKGKNIVSVAEFKAIDKRSTAINQLIVYLVMLNLSYGWVVLTGSKTITIEKITLNSQMRANLQARYECYKRFRAALPK